MAIIKTCFVLHHPGSVPLATEIAEQLQKDGSASEIYAAEEAYKKLDIEKLKGQGIAVNNFYTGNQPLSKLSDEETNALAQQVAKTCSAAKRVITDNGSPFAAKVRKTLAEQYPHIERINLYENPDSCVPGYSKFAADRHTQTIWFANKNHPNQTISDQVALDLSDKKRIGLGWSPLLSQTTQIEQIKRQRVDEKATQRRQDFLKLHEIQDRDQPIAFCVGGANSTFFDESLPKLLDLIREAKSHPAPLPTFVFHQHPRAKTEFDNRDIRLIQEKYSDLLSDQTLVISKAKLDEMKLVADLAIYDQTMEAIPLWAIMPTFQVRKTPLNDLLVSNHLVPSVQTGDAFIQALSQKNRKEIPLKDYYPLFGIDENWRKNIPRLL